MAAKGALGTDPKFKLAGDLQGLLAQRNDPKNAANRAAISTAIAQARKAPASNGSVYGNANPQDPAAHDPGADQMSQNWNGVSNSADNTINGMFNQINQQGQFNPGSFADQQKGAYDSVMNQFNQTNQTAFDKQEADWQQMAAERGWDPTNKDIQAAHTAQVTNPQQQARQQAESTAYGQGLAAQAQGFGQAAQQYQMPYQNLQTLDPFYRYQTQGYTQNLQDNFTGNQNYLNRNFANYQANQQQGFTQANAATQQQYQMAQMAYAAAHKSGGGGGKSGGGGGLSLADQMALQNNSFYNNMALQAGSQGSGYPQQNFGNGFAQGIGAALPTIIGAGLKS